MGGASAAVIWGGDPNYWANPALLPYQSGIRYEWGKTQLLPDLTSDVFFETKRLVLGEGGLTVSIAGKPLDGLGTQRLDYGTSVATDVDGNVVYTFKSYEDIESFGIGLSALRTAETVGRLLGHSGLRSLARFGDVSVGRTSKTTDVSLAPAAVTLDGRDARGKVTTFDSGVLFRATPYNSIDYSGMLPRMDRLASLRVDVTHGRSTQSYNDAHISYGDPSQADPVARISRRAWASRIALDPPQEWSKRLRLGRYGWALDFVTPLISWSKAWDRIIPTVRDLSTGVRAEHTRVIRTGWELTVANIFSIRQGHVDDPEGGIRGKTTGWGVGLNWGEVGGVRFDRATVPQSQFLDKVDREGFTGYVDPIRFREKLWPSGPGSEGQPRRATRVGFAVFGGYQTYSMSDVNDAIASPGVLFPGGSATADDIRSGAGFGLGVRLWPAERVMVALDGARLLAKTTGTAVFQGTPYTGELSAPATALTTTLSYLVPAGSRVRLGLGAGGGYYMSTGDATATASGVDFTTELDGGGLGFQTLAVGEVILSSQIHAEVGAGYRYAKTNDVEAAGQVLRNADGSKSAIDWSGFTSRVGLTFYLRRAPSSVAQSP